MLLQQRSGVWDGGMVSWLPRTRRGEWVSSRYVARDQALHKREEGANQ